MTPWLHFAHFFNLKNHQTAFAVSGCHSILPTAPNLSRAPKKTKGAIKITLFGPSKTRDSKSLNHPSNLNFFDLRTFLVIKKVGFLVLGKIRKDKKDIAPEVPHMALEEIKIFLKSFHTKAIVFCFMILSHKLRNSRSQYAA